jgi:small subunit ribosomal protein S18
MPQALKKKKKPAAKKDRAELIQHELSCKLCLDKSTTVDYKDQDFLRRFQTEQGKIISRRDSGNCPEHQKKITLAIKRSRAIGLSPL